MSEWSPLKDAANENCSDWEASSLGTYQPGNQAHVLQCHGSWTWHLNIFGSALGALQTQSGHTFAASSISATARFQVE